jgi:hypothetical protein
MLPIYLSAVVLLGACAVIGQAVLAVAGQNRGAWYGPAVGLATLIITSQVAVRLPGREATAAIVAVLLTLAGCAALWLRRPVTPQWSAFAVVVAAIGAASIPFIASGRVGLLGMGLNNDLALHLLWAEGLRDPYVAQWAVVIPGYPLGPHSLAISMSWLGGTRIDQAFTALMLAVVPMGALAAGALAAGAAGWRRFAVALAGGLAYLASAYYGQGAFKETMLAVALLAFVAYVRDLTRRPPTGAVGVQRAVIPAALLLAGSVYTFSHAAAAWFAAFLLVWGAGTVLLHPRAVRRLLRRDLVAPAALVALGTLVLLAVIFWPQLETIRTFGSSVGTDPAGNAAIPVTNLGNLPGPLSVYETFGLWIHGDFRFPPPNLFAAGQWAAVAIAAVAIGGVVALAARDLTLPAAIAGCAAIYWYSKDTQSPYVTAKALVVASPLLVATAATGLVGFPRGTPLTPIVSLRLAFGALFIVTALYASSLALRFSPVAHDAQGLRAFAPIVGAEPTLFLGHDDFVSSEMIGARLANPAPEGHRALPVALSDKPYAYGAALDWDSIAEGELDRFAYVIIPDGRYRSAAPPNFRLLRSEGGYELYQRDGETPPRASFDAQGSPGETLNCRTRAGRRLAQQGGVAAVAPAPVVAQNPGSIVPNGHLEVGLSLPAGRWDLSLQYVSPQGLQITAPGLHTRLPAYLGRPGPYFALGTVASPGSHRTTVVSVYEEHPSRLTSPQAVATLGALVATRVGERKMIPLAKACGRYVDWYRPALGR